MTESTIDIEGQEILKDFLEKQLIYAKENQTYPQHILLTGPAGYGKSTIVKYIKQKFGIPEVYEILGSRILNANDLDAKLTNIVKRGILFIDEIHSLPKKAFEILYEIFERNTVFSAPLYNLFKERFPELNLDRNDSRYNVPIWLIGATTYPGTLSKPLLSRFIQIRMEDYTRENILNIISQQAKNENIVVTQENLNIIVDHSRLNPRIAKKIYQTSKIIMKSDMAENLEKYGTLKKIGFYPEGVTCEDLLYMRLLESSRSLSLKVITSSLEYDKNFIEKEIEPFLIRKKFVEITSAGRELTGLGKMYLNKMHIRNLNTNYSNQNSCSLKKLLTPD